MDLGTSLERMQVSQPCGIVPHHHRHNFHMFRENPRVLKCNCCGRQLVAGKQSSKYVTWKEHAVADVGGAICGLCAADLDENGLFPNEPGYDEETRRGKRYGK